MAAKDLTPHIGIFGRRNSGKSSFMNALTGLDVSLVSAIPGTTTDPVRKSMEIFGLGPVVLIDTAGMDDEGNLGEKRVLRSLEVIKHIDCAVLIASENIFDSYEEALIKEFEKYQIPFFVVHNKSDLCRINHLFYEKISMITDCKVLEFSSLTGDNLQVVIDLIKEIIPETAYTGNSLLEGIAQKADIIILVTPIDSEAPEGRMILPQVMAIRDILDKNAVCIVLKETGLEQFLKDTGLKPKLVMTDSQAFKLVNEIIPKNIPLTSFSIAYAKMRGPFENYLKGTTSISNIKDGDKILILESCTHQVSCEDIGRVKIPRMITEFTGQKPEFEIVTGLGKIEREITDYKLIIHCGGCMVTRKQVMSRLKNAIDKGVPVTNYGMTLAFVNGIFERAVQPFR
jgi:[FeFe] hydrogenase H-cluster maturation GTPase HydF